MMDYIYTLPAWTWVAWCIGVFGGLLGAVLLLMRRRFAVWAFVVSFFAAAQLAYAAWVSHRGALR